MTTVSGGQVAIFYSLATGALLSKLVLLPNDNPVTFNAPTGQGVIVQSTTQPYDDVSCYALIAANTSFTPNDQTDRCVVLDTTNTVIAVHKRDPAILPVQAGEHALMLHPFADIGDVDVTSGVLGTLTSTFHRRYVLVGIGPGAITIGPTALPQSAVVSVAQGTVTPTAVTPPTPGAAQWAMPHLTAQVSDNILVPAKAPGFIAAVNAAGGSIP